MPAHDQNRQSGPCTVFRVIVFHLQQVSRSKGEDLAREYSIPFIETSAKGNVNVEEAFMYVNLAASLSAVFYRH